MARRRSGTSAGRRSQRRRTQRRMSLESLETRQLLAADLALGPPPANDGGGPGGRQPFVELAANGNRGGNQQPGGDQQAVGDQLAAATAENEYSIDGTGNNAANPDWGAAGEQLLRLTTVEYEDGISEAAGQGRPSAREISNTIADQGDESVLNSGYLTDLTWLWGQFIDHDIDLTENAVDENGDPLEPLPIEVPTGDADFDPFFTGTQTIGFNRSHYDEATGDSVDNPRQQINDITAFLDGSVVYGSDDVRADALRTFVDGKLKTSEGDLLPFNEDGLLNAGGPSSSLFLAGDIRANENAALSAMHTVWVREHNRLAEEILAEDPSLSDEEVYQQARATVIAQLQAITFNEFLPALLGYDAIQDYEGYDSSVNPGIANVFSTAAYRFGHSMLSTTLLRLNSDGTEAAEGNLSLRDAFFSPDELIDHGIDSILLGASSQRAQEIDNMVIDDIRNFLFGPPGAGGFDLASLNIQRGRDHGLADYNQTRVDYGLAPVEDFSDISSDPDVVAKLEALYDSVDDIDVWVGGLAEDHAPGSNMGELFTTIIADQFSRIRDGDANWYQNVLSGEELAAIENTSLTDVIQRNTGITGLRDNVFYDESVLVFDAANEPADVSLVVNDDQLELVNRRSGEVIESRAAADVTEVHLIGSDRSGDDFTIDLRRADVDAMDGLVIHGGDGDRNSLTILSSRETDDVVVDGNLLTINGMELEYSNLEVIRWETGGGDENIEVLAEGEARIVVEDGQGGRGRQGGRQGGGDGQDGQGPDGRDGRRGDDRDRRDNRGGGGQDGPQEQPLLGPAEIDDFFARMGEPDNNPFARF